MGSLAKVQRALRQKRAVGRLSPNEMNEAYRAYFQAEAAQNLQRAQFSSNKALNEGSLALRTKQANSSMAINEDINRRANEERKAIQDSNAMKGRMQLAKVALGGDNPFFDSSEDGAQGETLKAIGSTPTSSQPAIKTLSQDKTFGAPSAPSAPSAKTEPSFAKKLQNRLSGVLDKGVKTGLVNSILTGSLKSFGPGLGYGLMVAGAKTAAGLLIPVITEIGRTISDSLGWGDNDYTDWGDTRTFDEAFPNETDSEFMSYDTNYADSISEYANGSSPVDYGDSNVNSGDSYGDVTVDDFDFSGDDFGSDFNF
jgi:hypothetical protein